MSRKKLITDVPYFSTLSKSFMMSFFTVEICQIKEHYMRVGIIKSRQQEMQNNISSMNFKKKLIVMFFLKDIAPPYKMHGALNI